MEHIITSKAWGEDIVPLSPFVYIQFASQSAVSPFAIYLAEIRPQQFFLGAFDALDTFGKHNRIAQVNALRSALPLSLAPPRDSLLFPFCEYISRYYHLCSCNAASRRHPLARTFSVASKASQKIMQKHNILGAST